MNQTKTEEPLPKGRSHPSRMRNLIWAPLAPLLMGIFQAVPVRWLEHLITFGAHMFRRQKREREILRRNMDRILGMDLETPEGQDFAWRVYRNQIAGALEAIRTIHRPELLKVEGLWQMRRVFRDAEAAGKGILLVTAHLGSWEMIEVVLPKCLDNRFYELAKPTRIDALTKILEDLRLKAGTHVIWNDHPMLLRQMIRVLRKGHTLGLACDQKPRQLMGPVVDFLGRDTEFVGGPGAVASKTGCAVIAVYCTRQAPFTYRFEVDELYPPAMDDEPRRDVQEITQRIASSIEAAVRKTPDQWPWTYRRWIYEDEEWSGPRGREKKAASD